MKHLAKCPYGVPECWVKPQATTEAANRINLSHLNDFLAKHELSTVSTLTEENQLVTGFKHV